MSRAPCSPPSRGSRPAKAVCASICCRRRARAGRRSKPIACTICSPGSSGSAEQVRLLAVRYAGLDAVGHYYLRYANPDAFGDVSEDERRQFGRVLDDYYAYVDSLVGDALSSLGENDLLLVVSGFGMEPLTVRQASARARDRRSAVHRHARARARTASSSPTARPSLPPARRAERSWTSRRRCCISWAFPSRAIWTASSRTDLFTRAFNEQRTITFIPSYRVR